MHTQPGFLDAGKTTHGGLASPLLDAQGTLGPVLQRWVHTDSERRPSSQLWPVVWGLCPPTQRALPHVGLVPTPTAWGPALVPVPILSPESAVQLLGNVVCRSCPHQIFIKKQRTERPHSVSARPGGRELKIGRG